VPHMSVSISLLPPTHLHPPSLSIPLSPLAHHPYAPSIPFLHRSASPTIPSLPSIPGTLASLLSSLWFTRLVDRLRV
jgi:hypothetical protein